MKVGDKVEIYEDAMGQTKLEGLAILKEKCSTPDEPLWDGSHLEFWIVKFVGDDAGEFFRKIRVKS